MDVQEIIPQRYPFQLIDRLLDVEPGKQAIAQKLITIHEWYFAGQTTANPVVPRPILIESLAQTGVAAILSLPAIRIVMSSLVEFAQLNLCQIFTREMI